MVNMTFVSASLGVNGLLYLSRYLWRWIALALAFRQPFLEPDGIATFGWLRTPRHFDTMELHCLVFPGILSRAKWISPSTALEVRGFRTGPEVIMSAFHAIEIEGADVLFELGRLEVDCFGPNGSAIHRKQTE